MDIQATRRRAAQSAVELLPNTGVIGLGSGGTAALFIEGVAEAIRQGKKLLGVATSRQSRDQAESLRIPLLEDIGPWDIDLCVDGADEVSDELDLIKGGGGCHMREKIVNASARVNVIVVDEAKLSRRLGERRAIPIEVAPFGQVSTARHLERWGEVTLRMRQDTPWITDGGNYIYDLNVGVIEEPGRLEQELALVPGVLANGLFVNRADLLIIGTADGVRHVEK
jgi:ribose 5-phosphate isomerase A